MASDSHNGCKRSWLSQILGLEFLCLLVGFPIVAKPSRFRMGSTRRKSFSSDFPSDNRSAPTEMKSMVITMPDVSQGDIDS